MLNFIRGTLWEKSHESITILTQGLGWEVFLHAKAMYSLPNVGEEVQLYLWSQWKEDAVRLFGFLDGQERQIFMLLMGTSGVGPKLALSILNHYIPSQLVTLVLEKDLKKLTEVSGLGKKTAEKLLLDLKDKVKNFTSYQIPSIFAPKKDLLSDLRSVLQNLGYSSKEVESYIEDIGRDTSDAPKDNLDALVRYALKKIKETRSLA